MTILWAGLMALVLALSPEWQVRGTARLSLLFALPATLLLPWQPFGARFARLCWMLAYLAYLVHVAVAFHHAHGWSHAEAVAHVQRRSGFGQGIWFSHLFTLLWTLDVAGLRPRWPILAYMGFMAFNATVVYETGFIQAGGVIASLLILMSGAGRFFLGGSSVGKRIDARPDNSSMTQQPR
ncbi:MAG: hypothetical protein K2W96_10315 [Gemmataceae bacterium]|nr:hypothetical protein [Gemmataceae bacterium]